MLEIFRGQKTTSSFVINQILPSDNDLEIGEGSKRVCRLMSDDYVELHFSLNEYIELHIGDFIYHDGKRFVLTDPYKPSFNDATGGWDYQVRFDAQYYEWKNWKFKYTALTGSESSWTLTDVPSTHLRVLLSNLENNRIEVPWAFKCASLVSGQHQNVVYLDYLFVVTDEIAEIPKSITYSNVNLIDALSQMAQAWDTEWWISGNVIFLGKCEDEGDVVTLSMEDNVCSYNQSNSTNKYATRIYPFGSTRNLPNYYRKELIFTVTRVQSGVTYVDDDGVSHTGMLIADETRKMLPSFFADGVDDERIDNRYKSALSLVRNDFYPPSNTASDQFTASSIDVLSYVDVGRGELQSTDLPRGNYAIQLNGLRYELRTESNNVTKLTVRYKIEYPNGTSTATLDSKEEVFELGTPSKYFDADTTIPQDWNVNIDVDGAKLKIYVIVDFNDGIDVKESSIKFNAFGTISLYGATATPLSIGIKVNGGQTKTAIYNFGRYAIGDAKSGDYFLENTSGIVVGDTFVFADLSDIKLFNIPSSFFTKPLVSTDVTNAVTEDRLRLPIIDSSTEDAELDAATGEYYIEKDGFKITSNYIQDGSNVEVVEDIMVIEDIYPKYTDNNVISDVIPEPYTYNDNGVKQSKTAYRFKINGFDFDKDWIIKGQTLHVMFVPVFNSDGEQGQISNLCGMEFEVAFNPKDVASSDSDYQLWQLIPNENYGEELPNATLFPKVGDGVILLDWDVNYASETGLIPQAEEDLLDFVIEYIKKTRIDPNTYDCTMMADVMYNDGDIIKYYLGQRVSLALPIFGDNPRQSRIIGFEYPLDFPYDNPIYTVGESVAYSRIGDIENRLKEVNVNGKMYSVKVISNGGVGSSSGVGGISIVQSTGNDVNSVMSQAAVTKALNELKLDGYIGTTPTQNEPAPQELDGITQIGNSTTSLTLQKIVFANGQTLEVADVTENGVVTHYLKFDGNIFATGSISAGGINGEQGGGSGEGGGGSESGASALYQLSDILSYNGSSVARSGGNASAQNGDILAFNGTHWYAIPQSSISVVVDSIINSTSTNPLENKAIYAEFEDTPESTEVTDNFTLVLPTGEGGGTITIDSALSSTSTRAVQNKVIYAALQLKADASLIGTLSNLSTTAKTSIVAAINELAARTFTLSKATSSALGGILIGYTENDKNYAVKLDSDGHAYVTVPWVSGGGGTSGITGFSLVGDVTGTYSGGQASTSLQNTSSVQSIVKTIIGTVGYALISSLKSKGSATLPIYFDSDGNPQPITSYQGNAATATKLASEVSLWGQNFDGSSPINGDIIFGAVTNKIQFGSNSSLKLEIVNVGTAQNPVYALHSPLPFYSDQWISSGGIGQETQNAGAISELSDVVLTGLQDGYILVYDAATGKWKVEPKPQGGGGGTGDGSVTSVAVSVPTGFAVSGSPITTYGTIAITFASGYSLPTTAKQNGWDAAKAVVDGLAAWAKASTKPSYNFSEIGGTVSNSQLAHSSITIGTTLINLGDTVASLLGISKIGFASAATGEVGLEVVTIGGVRYLHTSLPFFSDQAVSAGGVGSGSGGGGGASYLNDLLDVITTGAENGQVLKFNGENWVASTIITELPTLLTAISQLSGSGLIRLTNGNPSVDTNTYALADGSNASGTNWNISILGNAARATNATNDGSGNQITSNYGASLSAAADALTLLSKSGATLSTITGANIVTVLGNTAVNVAKALNANVTIWGRTFKSGGDTITGDLTLGGDLLSTSRIVFSHRLSASTSGNVLEVVRINNVDYLHSTLPFYSDGQVSAGGVGSSGSGSGSSISVVNALNSTSTSNALSANMGRVLNELIDEVNGWLGDVTNPVSAVNDADVTDLSQAVEWLVDNKQDKISDLADIRSNASTALSVANTANTNANTALNLLGSKMSITQGDAGNLAILDGNGGVEEGRVNIDDVLTSAYVYVYGRYGFTFTANASLPNVMVKGTFNVYVNNVLTEAFACQGVSVALLMQSLVSSIYSSSTMSGLGISAEVNSTENGVNLYCPLSIHYLRVEFTNLTNLVVPYYEQLPISFYTDSNYTTEMTVSNGNLKEGKFYIDNATKMMFIWSQSSGFVELTKSYSRTEIDNMIGNIETLLDSLL